MSVVAPYFENNTCSPFGVNGNTHDVSQCQLGNQAVYAIDVDGAATAAAGIKFARDRNVRLIVKNTGHDYLGGSTGRGALALWTHNLKEVTLIPKYKSAHYTGPAYRIGAGVQFLDLYKQTARDGLRVVGGSCPTVGANGGWRQGGGHGPLSSAYGLGADNSLEYDVVTAKGEHLRGVSPKKHADLFYALSGGGSGNYAVVLSAVVKAHRDGPVAGSRLTFTNDGAPGYWKAVQAWLRHLLVLDGIPGFATEVLLSNQSFSLVMATLPGGDAAAMAHALAPFYGALDAAGVRPVVNETAVQGSYLEHYNEYLGGTVFTRNITIGGRLIPRDLVRDEGRLARLTATFRDMVAEPDLQIFMLGYNVTRAVAGVPADRDDFNAVTPAWRDSLLFMNLIIAGSASDPWPKLRDDLARVNRWQDVLRDQTPGGGGYINEGTFDAPQWKDDYFGGTYDRLRKVKSKYDPNFVLYTRPGVGADEYAETADGHLCKASK